MKLTREGLKEKEAWRARGYRIPEYDLEKVVKDTKENPYWLHFGAGNIFKAFQANVVQNLLNEGVLDRGIIAVGNAESIEKVNRPHDELNILMTLKSDGSIEKTVVGSVVESCILDAENVPEYDRLKEIFTKDSLQMISFTVTEKAYSLVDAAGEFLTAVAEDFENGFEKPKSYMGKVAALLYYRYKNGEKPLAVVSMDNCSHNGDILHHTINTFAVKWAEKGHVEQGFVDYINDKTKVTFPWSMIDKITPRPHESIEHILEEDGVEGVEPIITSRKTYIAPYVNAEESEYLVIENDFPNGRPALEKGGIMFTTRETVDKVETMKVCTCLNPLHTTLAVYGCLLGCEKICDEMKDPQLKRLVERVGYDEGLPVVINPGILDPKEFINTVLNVRIPNPFMPDTPQRIATDTSQKVGIRFGGTIRAYHDNPNLDVTDLKMIPLVLAGWLRYLMGTDDKGNKMELSADPLLDSLQPYFAGIKLGEVEFVEEKLKPLLESDTIFGVNLYKVGIADLVVKYFKELAAGPGAVRATLIKYV